MEKLRIQTIGFRGQTDQLSRIDKGFEELHHILTDHNPSIIYQNNPSFELGLEAAARWPNAKKIFTVLDVPHRLGNSYPFELIKSQLARADKICSISKDTQKDVKNIYGFDSEVIYNPLKIISRNPNTKKDIDLLFVGRLDQNKRFELVVNTAKLLNMSLHVCGPETPYHGQYHGIVDDNTLNELYNRSKYLICASHLQSGAQLPPLECQFAGCIPLQCMDNNCGHEFTPEFLAHPNPESLAAKIKEFERVGRVEIASKLIREAPLRYKNLHYLEVVRKILSIYSKIK